MPGGLFLAGMSLLSKQLLISRWLFLKTELLYQTWYVCANQLLIVFGMFALLNGQM